MKRWERDRVAEENVDANRVIYLFILGFILDEIELEYPGISVEHGTKVRALAERIVLRFIKESM